MVDCFLFYAAVNALLVCRLYFASVIAQMCAQIQICFIWWVCVLSWVFNTFICRYMCNLNFSAKSDVCVILNVVVKWKEWSISVSFILIVLNLLCVPICKSTPKRFPARKRRHFKRCQKFLFNKYSVDVQLLNYSSLYSHSIEIIWKNTKIRKCVYK